MRAIKNLNEMNILLRQDKIVNLYININIMKYYVIRF